MIWDNYYLCPKEKFFLAMVKNRNIEETNTSQKGLSIWFTGLSAAGKTTLAQAFAEELRRRQVVCCVLDADKVRKGMNSDLGYSIEHRQENIRRVAHMNTLMLEAGLVIINCFIQPTHSIRNMTSNIIGKENYFEVFVDCPLQVCEMRDPKGLYKKARVGEIVDFTGIDSVFETPVLPFLRIPTNELDLRDCVDLLLEKFFPIINPQTDCK